jgi:hypothetical protein
MMQPVQPGRKIYPAKCEPCEGKGKITDADRGDAYSLSAGEFMSERAAGAK